MRPTHPAQERFAFDPGGDELPGLSPNGITTRLATRILMTPRSWMISQGPSARDLALTGIAVDVHGQLVEDGLQFIAGEPAVAVGTQSHVLQHFQSEAPVPFRRTQRLQDGAVRQYKVAVADTLIKPRERAPKQCSSLRAE